jgi:hypothetical protein
LKGGRGLWKKLKYIKNNIFYPEREKTEGEKNFA